MASTEINDYGVVFKRPLSANENEQLSVYLEAFEIFLDREKQYKSLWQRMGARDSFQHVVSKAARCQFYLEGSSGEDTPLDLINFAAFLIRNMRAGRIHPQTQSGDATVVETWRVLDKWWTEEPECREYRTVGLSDGSRITQFRNEPRQPWQVYAGG